MLTVSQTGGEVEFAYGMRIASKYSYSFGNCPRLDYLLSPGRQGIEAAVKNDKLLEFVRRQAQSCKAVMSVCTGAFILAAAGLLDGKKATTHRERLKEFREFMKSMKVLIVEDDMRYVREDAGKIWTAGGVAAGIDLALALIEDITTDGTAAEIRRLCNIGGTTVSEAHT